MPTWSKTVQPERTLPAPFPQGKTPGTTDPATQWLVLAGQGVVPLGEESLTVQLGQLLAAPVTCVHRASAGPVGLEILEVERGIVLREDDIERLEDEYGRCEPA